MTMYLKKYFSEGLIQVAILLSLCGVMVDVGLEPRLPPSWHQMILGQTSALTQTQFHNLRNRLEDGHDSHTKNVDLDGFFTTRRLLGWVRSLDRLQIPQPEVETWLVQREPDPRPDQLSLLERGAGQVQRELTGPAMSSRPGLAHLQEEVEAEEEEEVTHLHNHHALHHTYGLDENGQEEEDEEEDMMGTERPYQRTPDGAEADQMAVSLQECLRLLEETFPFSDEHQLDELGGQTAELGCPVLSATDEPSPALELDWQDLFDLMEPQTSDVDMTTSYDGVSESVRSGTSATKTQANDLLSTDANRDVHLQHDLLWSTHRPQPELLPLTPSAELDAQSSTFDLEGFSKSPEVNNPPDHMDLLFEDSTGDFSMGENVEDDTTAFNMDLLTRDPVENLEEGEHALYPGNPNFLTVPQSLGSLISPPSIFLEDQEEEDGGSEDLPGQLSDLLEDAVILDEMRLLDLALEEGFSPEMAARLQEEGYLHDEESKRSSNGPQPTTAENHRQPFPTDVADDSDSGLSLDFSYSPSASPCASEASCYSSSSSSSSSSSASSSSCMSEVDRGQVEDEDAGRMFAGVRIKQEKEEEELGAVGGEYPEDVKTFLPASYGHHKMLNGAPWLEHVGHDHTYNQRLSSAAPPSPSTKPSHHNPKRFFFSSESKIWGRDERRARVLKIPFSNQLIVNLPVEEFNDLLSQHKLSEEQLSLVRDIRRRGKNKIAAQNCRKRKMDVLLELDDDVTVLRRRRARLLREKQEALRNLQEMKRRLGTLYQEIFSRLRDEEGMPLDSEEFFLQFESSGGVTVTSRQQEGWTPLMEERTNKKQKNKRK